MFTALCRILVINVKETWGQANNFKNDVEFFKTLPVLSTRQGEVTYGSKLNGVFSVNYKKVKIKRKTF